MGVKLSTQEYTQALFKKQYFKSYLIYFDAFLEPKVQRCCNNKVSFPEFGPKDMLWLLKRTKEKDMCQNGGFYDTVQLL